MHHEYNWKFALTRSVSFVFITFALVQAPLLGEEVQDNQAEIERLLAKGEELFKKWYYTTPPGDEKNASSVYQKVLSLDPANETAKTQIAKMEDYYIRKSNETKAAGNESKFKRYCEKIIIINPGNAMAREVLGLDPVPEPTPVEVAEEIEEADPEPEKEVKKQVSRYEQQRLYRYNTYSEAIIKLLEEGDELYRQRNAEDQTPVRQSINKFEQVLRIAPDNYDALWQVTRVILWFGDHISEEKKEEVFTKGMDYGKKAVEINPNGVEGRYWYGSNIGRYGVVRGIFKSLKFISPLVDEMEAILKLDPNYYKAHMVLGILYRKAPPWPVGVGDIERSEQFLKRSLAIYPQGLHSHLELGITYNKLKMWDKAKVQFQKVIDMPFEEVFTPENKEYKEEAREILMMMKRRGL